VTLPQGVNEESIKADYNAGVLEVRVPKPAEPKPKRIPLGGTEQKTIEGSGTRS
jgi:HSP20 family protein